MAHTVYLGSFNKRLNSTKQPTYSGWASYSCVFKDETSLIRPTIRLSADLATFSSSHFNYAYMLGRYYWITDFRSVRSGYVEVDMSVDVLATCKSAIQATSAFIEYGFNTFNAGDSSSRVADNRMSVKENPIMYSNDYDVSGGILSRNTGCYVLQAVGNDQSGGSHKGLGAFVLDQADMARLMTAINSTISNDLSDIFQNSATAQVVMNRLTEYSIKTELLNESAMAAIQSVKWLPLTRSSAVGSVTALYLGNFATGISTGVMLSQSSIYKHDTTMAIPWPVSDWERNNCQLILYLPFFGTIPIPTDQAIDQSSVYVEWTTEYFSGSVSVIVSVGNYVVYAGSTNISVEMGIGRSQVGTSALIGGGLQMLGGAMQMAGGVVDVGASVVGAIMPGSGTSFANALSSIPGGASQMVAGMAQTVQPAITSAGCMGGMAAIGQTQDASITCIYYPAIGKSDFSAKYGHPVFKVDTPAAGFCKTRGFSVSLAEPGPMAAMINAMMDGGVFIE